MDTVRKTGVFETIDNILMDTTHALSSITLAILIGITIANVFSRYVLLKPFGWGEEITLALMVWVVFLGSGMAIRRRSVVSIDVIYLAMPLKMRKVVKILTTILCVGAYLIVVYLGIKLTTKMGNSYTPYLRLKKAYIYCAIPIGSFFSIWALIGNLRDVLTGNDLTQIEVEMENAIQAGEMELEKLNKEKTS